MKRSKYLQPAVFQAKIQTNATINVIQDGPVKKFSQSPKPPTKIDQTKTIRQQLGANPFDQDQYGQQTELGQISQSFSNQTLGANDRKHNQPYDLHPAKSPEAQDRQHLNFKEDRSPITKSPKKIESHLSPLQLSKKKQTPSRNYKNQGGYIDNVHDLCLHSTNELRPRSQLQDLRNISARKYQVSMRENSRNQKDKLKSVKKKPVNSLNEVNVDNVKKKQGTSLIEHNQASADPNMVSAFSNIDSCQTMPNQSYGYQMQAPFNLSSGTTTTQYGGVNLVLPIQQFAQQQPFGNPSPITNSLGLPSNEFLSLKEISEHLGQKIDLIQNQISRISTSQRSAQYQEDLAQNSSEPDANSQQNRFQEPKKSNQGSELIQHDSKLKLNEAQDQKFQIFKLKEQIKLLEERLSRDQDLHKDKSQTLETHIKMLQEDNKRLSESIKQRKEQVQGAISAQIKVKDSLIEELTSKLKESTKVIQHIKTQNKKLKEEAQKVQAQANQTFETQLQDARTQIEEQLSKQLNSTISEQLAKQFEERLLEAAKNQKGGDSKYKQQLADKDREIMQLSEKHEIALKAAEDAIQEAKKAVESRKNSTTDLQVQIRQAIAEEFKQKLAKAEAMIKEREIKIDELSSSQKNDKIELAKAHAFRIQAIQDLRTHEQNQIEQDAIKEVNEVELTQLKNSIALSTTTIKDLQRQIQDLTSEKQQMFLQNDALASETQALKQNFNRQLESLKSSQNESEKFILTQLQDAQTKVIDVEQQLKRAKENTTVMEAQLARAIDQKSQDHGMVQMITQQFQQKLQQADTDLSNSRKSQKEAETQALEMIKIKEELQIKVADFDAQLKQSQIKFSEQEKQLRIEIEHIKNQGQNDKNEVEKLKESKKDLTLKLAKSQKENLMKTKEDEKAKKVIQDELDKAQEQLREKSTEIEELEKEHVEQLNYINQIKRSEEALKQTNESQSAQLKEISEQLQQLTASQKKQEDEMTETFMTELNSVQTQLDAKTQEAARITNDNQRISQENKIQEEKVKSLQMALNQAISLKQGQVVEHDKKHLEQLNQISQLQDEVASANQLALGQKSLITELKARIEDMTKKESLESLNRDNVNLQMQQALESALIKQQESVQQAFQLKQEVERVNAEARKAQNDMQTQIQNIQSQLAEKQTQIQKLTTFKDQFEAQNLTLQSQKSQLLEYQKQIEGYKQRENQLNQNQSDQNSQMQMVLQATSQKAAESAAQIQSLTQQINQLQASQKKSEDEITETFMTELNSVQTQLDTKTLEATKLTNQVQKMQQDAKTVGDQMIALKKALGDASKAKTEAEELTEITVEKLKADYEIKMAQLQTELDKAVQMKRDSSTKRMEAQNEKAKELGELKGSMEKQQDDTQQVILKFTMEMSQKDKQIMDAKNNYNKLIQQIAKLEEQSAGERDHLQKEIKKNQTQIKLLETEAARASDLESELQSIKSKLELKENELQQANLKLSQTQSDVNDLQSLVAGLSKSPGTKQPTTQKTVAVEETQTVKNLRFENDTLQNQVQDQTKELAQLQDTNLELQRQVNELKSLKPTKEQAAFEDEIKKNVQQLMVKEAELDSLRKQVKELKDTISNNDNATQMKELQRKVAIADQEKSMNRMIIEQLNQELTTKDAELIKKGNQEKQLTETVQKLSMQIATLSMQAMSQGKK